MMHSEIATRAQVDMWLAQKANPDVLNNIVACWDVDGPIDITVLDEAHRIVLSECPDLRLSFGESQEGLTLIRHEVTGEPSHNFDASSFDSPEKQAIRIITMVARDSFDLRVDQLYRMGSIKLTVDRFMVFMIFHHIVTDGIGILSYCHRLADVYSDLSSQDPIRPWAEGMPSAIARQEQNYLESTRYNDDLAFWGAYLSEHAVAPVLRETIASKEVAEGLLRAANPMSVVADGVGISSVAVDFSQLDVKNLERAAESLEVKVPTLLVGATAIAFRRLSASSQFTFAIAVANRRGRARMAPGLAANAIPIQVKVDAQQSLAKVVKTIAEELPTLYRHSSVPVSEIRRQYFPLRQDRSPIGPVLSFIPVNNKISFAGSAARLYGSCIPNLDELMISFYDNGDEDGLRVSFDAPADLYTRELLGSIAVALLTSVRELADVPEAFVGTAKIKSPAKARREGRAASVAPARSEQERPPYRAPRDSREEQLSRIFADALGVDKVGIDDDFFQLGGNSLSAISLIAKLRRELDTEIAIRDLFQAPTIAKLMKRGSVASASARPTLRRMT